MEAQLECILYTLHIHVHGFFFCTFRSDLHTQSVLRKNISASGFSQKFIKSALLVGYDLHIRICIVTHIQAEV